MKRGPLGAPAPSPASFNLPSARMLRHRVPTLAQLASEVSQ